jgi:hypothetical protein
METTFAISLLAARLRTLPSSPKSVIGDLSAISVI